MQRWQSEHINLAWGKDTLGKSKVYRWFKKSDKGEESLKDQPSSGRPKEVDRQAVLEACKSEFCARGIELLPEKWQEVFEVGGEYFD
ncbi:hypothetical protein KIN20_019321 [Parelaphostrongylus tenuis]|uniref:Uncharacterized protein n=1 Tax=Parelaphostrongylus tenuis TaxID=148309 RepID=A0AAD5MPC7_PARTN|nr:hypothetical protein KIN20_019321 [Parelaphostrongylus tenuis]